MKCKPKLTRAQVSYTEVGAVLYATVTLMLLIYTLYFTLEYFNVLNVEPTQLHTAGMFLYIITTVLIVGYVFNGVLRAIPITEKFPVWYTTSCACTVIIIGIGVAFGSIQILAGISALAVWIVGFRRFCKQAQRKTQV